MAVKKIWRVAIIVQIQEKMVDLGQQGIDCRCKHRFSRRIGCHGGADRLRTYCRRSPLGHLRELA
jgi:hypothetical protein